MILGGTMSVKDYLRGVGHRGDSRDFVILASILLVAFALRFYRLDFNDMGNDVCLLCKRGTLFFQGYPWLISMYRGGPFAAIMPGLSTKLFGVSAVSCCLPSLIAGVLVVALTYTFGGVLFNRRVGLIAAAVVAVSAPSVLMSRFVSMSVDFFFVLTIYTFYRYIREKKLYLGVVTSLVFTVGIMTRQTILLCVPICLFIAWRYDKNLSFLKSKDFLLLTLPFWIIAYPYLLFAFFQGQFTDVAIGYTALLTDTFSASGLLWFGIPYYINAIFTYFSPLNFLLFVSVAAFILLKFYQKKLGNSEWICIIWFLFVFLFYALLIEKHKEFYISPVLYPLAFLGGALFDSLLKNKKKVMVVFVLLLLLSGNALYSYNTIFIKEEGFRVPYDTCGSYNRDGLKALGWYMHHNSSPDDVIVSAGLLDSSVEFYTNRMFIAPSQRHSDLSILLSDILHTPEVNHSRERFAISTPTIDQPEEKAYIEEVKKKHPLVAVIRVDGEDAIYIYDLKESNLNITPDIINSEEIGKEYENTGGFYPTFW